MTYVITILCFSLFSVLFLSLFKKGNDVFAPSRLLLMIWSLALGLASLKLSRYQIEWTLFSWLMFAIAIGSLLLGFYVVFVLHLGSETKTVYSIRQSVKQNTINTNLLFKYAVLLFFAYLISYIVSAIIIGYLPFFTRFPGLTRNDWGIFGFGLFVQSFPAVIYLAVLYFIFEKKNAKKKFVMSMVVIVSFVTYAFLLQRYYVVLAIVMSMVAIYYSTNLFKPRNVVFITLLIVAVFFGMSFIRLTGTIVNYLYYLSDMKFSVKYAIFTEPYMYVVMNLENFANAVNLLEKHTYGLFTFDFVFALTGIKHMMFKYLALPEFPHIITSNYNTYTMFFIYFWDFGVFGLAVIPFLIGMFIGSAYNKMKRNPNINTISVYAIFSFVIIFSFFIPIISFLHFAFNYFVIYLVTWLINEDDKKRGSETNLLNLNKAY